MKKDVHPQRQRRHRSGATTAEVHRMQSARQARSGKMSPANTAARGPQGRDATLAAWRENWKLLDVASTERLLVDAIGRWGVDLAFAAIKTMSAYAFDWRVHRWEADKVLTWMRGAAFASLRCNDHSRRRIEMGPNLPTEPELVIESGRRAHLDDVYRRMSFGDQLSPDELGAARRLQNAVAELQAAQAQATPVLARRKKDTLSSMAAAAVVSLFSQHKQTSPSRSELADLALLVGADSSLEKESKRMERWKQALGRAKKRAKNASANSEPAFAPSRTVPRTRSEGIAWWDPRTMRQWKESTGRRGEQKSPLPTPSCCVPEKSEDKAHLTMWSKSWGTEDVRATWKMVESSGSIETGLWWKLVKTQQ